MSLRITYVVSYYRPALVYGGPVQSIAATCEALARLGAEVTVLTTDANGRQRLPVPLGEPVRIDGVTVRYHAVVGPAFYSPALIRACRAHLAAADLAVLEVLWTPTLFAAAAACRRARVPYVVPLRGQLLPWARRRHAWRKRAYWWLGGRRIVGQSAAVLCTDAAEAAAFGALGLAVPRLVIPNGLALPSRWGRQPSRLRAKLGIPETARVVLMLGRLHAKKRPRVAVEATGRLVRAGVDVHLVLAGPGDANVARALRACAGDGRCADRVHLTGLLDREGVEDALGGADVLVMPSELESENFGMAAAEALAAGVPVVGSIGIPAVETAARHGAGRCVSPEAAAVAVAIAEVVRDPARLSAMRATARGVAETEFDVRRNAERLLDAYGTLAGRGERSVVKP